MNNEHGEIEKYADKYSDDGLKQKISQMFITGFKGEKPDKYFETLVEIGLGGVIFFTHNIKSQNQFKNLISDIFCSSDCNITICGNNFTRRMFFQPLPPFWRLPL